VLPAPGRGLRVAPEPQATRRERRREGGARRDGLDADAAALFEHLRATRLEFARAEGIAAFMVFPDRTLIEMATCKPRDANALRSLHGVGERKLQRYGEAFLASLAEWARQRAERAT
jgi:ATP-dependent DNA helicase RecQ